jgi:RHS repeat-associated protein
MKSTGNWTRNYVYETATNRLLKHDSEQTLNDYTYDAHGNITSMPHLSSMLWNEKDELIGATNGTFVSYYNYDAEGNRTRKVVEKNNVREERYYINGYEIFRKYVSDSLDFERKMLNISDDEKVFVRVEQKTDESEVVRYQYDNHLGSACLELDTAGQIISYEEYHPFGTTSYRSGRTEVEVSLKRYKFQGKEKDEETMLYYFGARYYAPWIGRWTSVDPAFVEQPQWSTYKSFNDNPIMYIDPDGKTEYLKIVLKDTQGNSVTIGQTQPISKNIITDGKKHKVEGWKPFKNAPTATWHYENNYYDFEKVFTVTQNKDGSIPLNKDGSMKVEESFNILTENGIRDTDVVITNGAEYGKSKLNISEWWESMKTGGSQPSGWHLYSADGGVDPTRTTATEGDVTMINVDFLLALSAYVKSWGIPSIKDPSGLVEFLSILKDLITLNAEPQSNTTQDNEIQNSKTDSSNPTRVNALPNEVKYVPVNVITNSEGDTIKMTIIPIKINNNK